MKHKRLTNALPWSIGLLILAVLFITVPPMANAQKSDFTAVTNAPVAASSDTAFSYQNCLTVKGQPANGLHDFTFVLYDATTGGNQLGATQIEEMVKVADGAFAVSLDFGDVLADGPRYLEVRVRPSGANRAFTTLTPRQAVSALAATARSPLAITAATMPESWKLGVTSEGTAAYSAIIGRAVGEVATFRSNRGTTDVYYIFPAPSTQRTVQAAKFYILSRTGTYANGATLTLEILHYAGTAQHTVSAAGIDVKTAPTSTWTDIALSGTPADLEIAPGEFLAFHFSLSGAPTGDLDVRPIFEVEVQ